jgi:ribosomal protein S18 acetylase RimI-like enzyme
LFEASLSSGLIFYRVQINTETHQRVLEIQEQYKKFFFVRFAQLEAAIRLGQVIAASIDGAVVGYIWSARRNGVVRIRYLAVDPKSSKKGIGKALVNHLQQINDDAYSMQLSCRIDYPGWNFWKKVGFRVLRNRPGIAKAGSTLTDFCFDLTPLPLFQERVEIDKPKIAFDSNVYFDIEDLDRPHHKEAIGLMADWLTSEFEYCITSEIHNDIARADDATRSNASTSGWNVLEGEAAAVRCIFDKLVEVIGRGDTPQDISDRKHLAHAIAENLTAFITRDEFLLESADNIYDQFGIILKRPSDFIVDADILLNQTQYHRQDLTAVGISISRISNPDSIERLVAFRRGSERERVMRSQLRAMVAHPDKNEIKLITSQDAPIGLFTISLQDDVLEVPMLRCSAKIEGQRRSRSLVRYLLSNLRSYVSKSCILKITDPSSLTNYRDHLIDAGFVLDCHSAYKFCLPGVWTPENALAQVEVLSHAASVPAEVTDQLYQKFQSLTNAEIFLELEHLLHPCKLLSSGIVESIVVPIRPRWARALFDPNLGQAEFWHQDADLLLNPASAYYTASRPKLLFGRILWYISEDGGYAGSKAIRACSQMTGRVIDTPINLYRKFRHFGIYQLADVESLAKKKTKVMAMQFTDTELFSRRITLAETRKVLNCNSETFQWPTSISEKEFFELYEKGHS